MSVQLYCGDCLEVLPTLQAGSVDAVVTDPPYGTTDIAWDKGHDWDTWWAEIERMLAPNSLTICFSAQPFTTDLINSNRRRFLYELIWCKTMGMGFLDANKRPLKAHENILVFGPSWYGQACRKLSTYNPQWNQGKPYVKARGEDKCAQYAKTHAATTENDGRRHPLDYITFSNGNNHSEHPTQKPVDLMAWLIRSYSNEGDTILDPFMGSGTTGVACVQTGRNFIGIEIDPMYFAIAQRRIAEAQQQLALPLEVAAS